MAIKDIDDACKQLTHHIAELEHRLPQLKSAVDSFVKSAPNVGAREVAAVKDKSNGFFPFAIGLRNLVLEIEKFTKK